MENLNNIYHLSMIIAGFYLMILATVAVTKLSHRKHNNSCVGSKKNKKHRRKNKNHEV